MGICKKSSSKLPGNDRITIEIFLLGYFENIDGGKVRAANQDTRRSIALEAQHIKADEL
jgi:hypothetical protein